jgi:hypothetical protein
LLDSENNLYSNLNDDNLGGNGNNKNSDTDDYYYREKRGKM